MLNTEDISVKDKLVLYTGYLFHSFGGNNYAGKVRGSEIAFIKLSEQLSAYYDVYVSGPKIEASESNGVTYFNSSRLQTFLDENDIEILIVNRYIHFFIEFTNTANKTYLWLHDMQYQPFWEGMAFPDEGKHLVANVLESIDKIICLTDWHKSYVMDQYKLPSHKLTIIGNGLEKTLFEQQIDKIPNRFIYLSLPERGLSILLAWFPRIRKRLHHAELHIYTDNVPLDMLELINKTTGVFYHGKVSQQQVTQELLRAEYWLYPNIFLETYCMSAHEAQAAGCICVTRNMGSLGEVVSDRGVLIDGDPAERSFQEEALQQMMLLNQEPDKKQKMLASAKEWALQRTWKERAKEWERLFNAPDSAG